MSAVATKTRYTPADLLRMPDGNRYELVDGQLVEKNMSFWSSFVAGNAYLLLGSHCKQTGVGWVVPEGTTYQCFPDAPQKIRKPDLSYIRFERWSPEQATEEGHTPIAPDLAIEVVSPNDLAYEVENKVEELLRAGVRWVWVVNPEMRTVSIHRADGSVRKLHEQDEICGEDELSGFRCRVAEFFVVPAKLKHS